MANPRRNSYPTNTELPIFNTEINFPLQSQTLAARLSRLKFFLKKPQAFPFLLSVFLILTWIFLRIQQRNSQFPSYATTSSTNNMRFSIEVDEDHDANVIRFSSGFPSPITNDKRGWMLDPVSIALDSGIPGGATICASIHVGEIKPGGMRGNHRHHTCNETFLIWGARTMFRLENNALGRGFAQVTLAADEVAVAVSPSGTAHALLNMDSTKSTYIIGCQDCVNHHNNSDTDFKVWGDLYS
ncbi:hypothetical protein L2E82_05847 [Cichorium intybus]|uniref:Uncharacterized protein n=1 Tax=Cichorium intybus TaxID=13427 RepID=A0ACB9H7W6_CICIN|nr:hypothetical protein L2E82_05847 [Cichorium intybus]